MIRPLRYLLAILFLTLAGLACRLVPAGSAPLGPCANPYLPTTVNATWQYDVTGTVDEVFTRSVLTADASGFTDQDIFHDSGILRTGKWKCDHGSMTRLDFNSSPTAFVATNLPSLPEMAFQTTDSSGVTLPARINSGDTWSQTTSLDGTQIIRGKNVDATSDVAMTCTASGPESVVVPAGTFNAMRLVCQFDQTITVTVGDLPAVPAQFTYTTTDWYAPNVGWVKSVTTGTNIDTTVRLASYTIP